MKNIHSYKSFNESYKHTIEDKKADMVEIEKFTSKFESMFNDELKLKVYEDAKFRDYLGHGASKIYLSDIDYRVDGEYESINDQAMIFLTTDINPNGISSGDDIGRTYTINYELKGKVVNVVNGEEFQEDTVVRKFYSFERTIDEVLEKFKKFVDTELK